MGQIKYPMKKILTSISIYHGFLSLCKKLETFHKPIQRKWYETQFSSHFQHFRAKNPRLSAKLNIISDEKNVNIIFNISRFPIIMQKIRMFPRANLEKMVQNPVFGPFLAFSGQKSAIMGRIKYPIKKILTSFSIYHGFQSLCKKLESFHKPNSRKWQETLFSAHFQHFRAKNPPLWSKLNIP